MLGGNPRVVPYSGLLKIRDHIQGGHENRLKRQVTAWVPPPDLCLVKVPNLCHVPDNLRDKEKET